MRLIDRYRERERETEREREQEKERMTLLPDFYPPLHDYPLSPG